MSEDLKLRFGKLLAAHRKRSGMTQPELAEAALLSTKMIQRIEGGKSGASFDAVERLAKALAVDPADLFSSGVPASLTDNAKLSRLIVRLAKASDKNLDWLDGVLDNLLTRKL